MFVKERCSTKSFLESPVEREAAKKEDEPRFQQSVDAGVQNKREAPSKETGRTSKKLEPRLASAAVGGKGLIRIRKTPKSDFQVRTMMTNYNVKMSTM
jgi:hypothetical protein